MESSSVFGDMLYFLFENMFIFFMLYMWVRTPTRSELKDAEMRMDLRLKRIHDHEREMFERIAALDERTKK